MLLGLYKKFKNQCRNIVGAEELIAIIAILSTREESLVPNNVASVNFTL